jgi:hypothetical protein
MIDNRMLLQADCMQILSELREATHEQMGSLMVHTGTHPVMGEIVTVASQEKDSVLIHGEFTPSV